jgi:hypothetical protein
MRMGMGRTMAYSTSVASLGYAFTAAKVGDACA